MKSYASALNSAAKHQVYMERSCCFTAGEMSTAHMVAASVLMEAYDCASYGHVEWQLRREVTHCRNAIDMWYDEYVESHEELD